MIRDPLPADLPIALAKLQALAQTLAEAGVPEDEILTIIREAFASAIEKENSL